MSNKPDKPLGPFRTLTEKVMWWLDWIFVPNQLPEDQAGPFGRKGGGKQTIKLGEGERLEFVLIPAPASIWLARQPIANPKRKKDFPEKSQGLLPLAVWLFLLPMLMVAARFATWFLVYIKNPEAPPLPTWPWILGSIALGLVLFLFMYWGYEWNRRHYRLVVTTLIGYFLVFKAITREYHRSPTPTKLIEEHIADSSWSGRPGYLGHFVGGWLNELQDTGDINLGSRAQDMSDFLQFLPYITGLQEILQAIYSAARARDESLRVAYRMMDEAKLRGYADEVTSGSMISSSASQIQLGIRQANAIIDAWRREHPNGEEINLASADILGFTRWNLETGEPLKTETA